MPAEVLGLRQSVSTENCFLIYIPDVTFHIPSELDRLRVDNFNPIWHIVGVFRQVSGSRDGFCIIAKTVGRRRNDEKKQDETVCAEKQTRTDRFYSQHVIRISGFTKFRSAFDRPFAQLSTPPQCRSEH